MMDILATGLQGFIVGAALAALVMLVLDIHLRTDAHIDARRRNQRYEVRDWTPWWTRDGER